MDDLKYFEILDQRNKLRNAATSKPLHFRVLSNITVNQLNEIAEYYLLSAGINPFFESGNYDNIVQDAQTTPPIDGIVVFWEAANLINGLHYKINTFTEDEYGQILDKVRSEITLFLNSISKFSLVIFNQFSSLIINSSFQKKNNFDRLCDELNHFLKKKLPESVILIDIDKLISLISVENSFSPRDFIGSKKFYTVDFFKAYSRHIVPVILSASGKLKKAMIFDCDNTLWSGIVGEDGSEGINISENNAMGRPYHEVQNLAVELNKQGVIIGLCSKNNPEDVEYILEHHPDMILKNKYITVKKINWNNKAQNLKEIAGELNIGLDSIVFVDDNDFEINLIKEQIPEIHTIQVPDKRYQYPQKIRESFSLFYKSGLTEEDLRKTEMYAEQIKRKQEEYQHASFEDYLKSLEMVITVSVNHPALVPRLAQMTQKTNQFNLTTKRYTESQISAFVNDSNYDVYAMGVTDKFGDSGITGLAIIHKTDEVAEIDTFLMSCRIIGRNLEYKFLDSILLNIEQKEITANYIQTPKNVQTSNFYDTFGFNLVAHEDARKEYVLLKDLYIPKIFDYIKIVYER